VGDVTRVDHLPLVGARLRELAVTETLEALIPPHEGHAVTVGEGLEAWVLVILTGEPALSRVAATLAGDDWGVIFPRPMDAAPCHDHRWGRVWDAWWGAGRDRLDGAVISQASQRAGP